MISLSIYCKSHTIRALKGLISVLMLVTVSRQEIFRSLRERHREAGDGGDLDTGCAGVRSISGGTTPGRPGDVTPGNVTGILPPRGVEACS